MLVKKEIIPGPGTWWYKDSATNLPRQITFTSEGIQHFHDTGKQMLAAGLKIPVPLEHQPDAMPMSAADYAAHRLRNNAGEVKGFEITPDGKLLSELDVQDKEVASKLGTTIKWTSPWITSFTDGQGKSWDGVIGHVALTSRPRITDQAPFPSLEAALSLTENSSSSVLAIAKGNGIPISPFAQLVDGKPRYPMAFSLYATGVPLANIDMKKEAKQEPPKGKDAGKERKKEQPPLDDDLGEESEEADDVQSKISDEGDIPVCDVLCDLLEMQGITLMDGTDNTNFLDRLYGAVMEKMKMEKGGGDMANQPNTGSNQLPKNPTVAEQPPLYMSMDDLKGGMEKITDPQMKAAFGALLSLTEENRKQNEAMQKHAFASATARFQDRVKRLCAAVPSATRDVILTQTKDAKLSMGDDGAVHTSADSFLDAFEVGLKAMGNVPSLLTTPSAAFSEIPQPKDFGPEIPMTEERRQEIVAEYCKNAMIKDLPKAS